MYKLITQLCTYLHVKSALFYNVRANKLKQLLGLGATRHTLFLSLSTGVVNLGTSEQLKHNSFF